MPLDRYPHLHPTASTREPPADAPTPPTPRAPTAPP